MRLRKRVLAGIVCLIMIVSTILNLVACGGQKSCDHHFGEWIEAKAATCTETGFESRKCEHCDEIETQDIEALGHDFEDANCTSPKKCKRCDATEGEAMAHSFTVEAAKPEALKNAASCLSAEVYYKSCACGAVSTNPEETFIHGEPKGHLDADKNHVCDNGCGDSIGSCADTNKDHVCDYGCGKSFGEHADSDDANHLCDYGCNKIADNGCYDTVVDGKCDECSAEMDHEHKDENKDHGCDICSKTMSVHTDPAKDHACDYCGATIGDCKDVDRDHACDYGCSLAHGDHSDSNDADHFCDYGCGQFADGGCYTNNRDGMCDECGESIVHDCANNYNSATCTQSAICRICGHTSGTPLGHKDSNKDHVCDNGCGNINMNTDQCVDVSPKDHRCDYGGHIEGGCSKFFDDHADGDDSDHRCDYCSGEIVGETCHDGDEDFVCDECGAGIAHECNTEIEATCMEPAKCSKCGEVSGNTPDGTKHKDEDKNHVCDYGCGKNDIGDHNDSDEDGDNDHLCDYGCGKVADDGCYDDPVDGDHNCDECDQLIVGDNGEVEHVYAETDRTEATCESPAIITYTCECGNFHTENEGEALGHDTEGVEGEQVWNGTCEYKLVYECKECHADIDGDTIVEHNYVASISKAATCQEVGEKTFKCSKCGDTSKAPEEIPADPTGHNWEQQGDIVGGVRTDKCSVCNTTKTVTVYEDVAEDLTANDFQNEIEVNNANISLGQGVIDKIGEDTVTLSADKLEGDARNDLGLTPEQLEEQVGDSPIYNFTINNGTENISDFGEDNYVTITLPYTLKVDENGEIEDVDSIAIWFIADKCVDEACETENCEDALHRLVSMPATYNNGFVTFKTNHFSYYTVTRLTPAERCALYTHNYAEQTVAGSCTQDAYIRYVCIRCGHTYTEVTQTAPGHDYVEDERISETCTTNGKIVYKCQNDGCNSTKTEIIDEINGHDWKSDEISATCLSYGYTEYVCQNDGCGKSYKITTSQKAAHSCEKTETVGATCTTVGYDLYECTTDGCEYSYKTNYVAATGHSYGEVTEDNWTWAEDLSSATFTLECQNDCEHTVTLNAAVAINIVTGNCSGYMKSTYTAKAIYNRIAYTSEKTVEKGTPDHKFADEMKYDNNLHWHECICGERQNVAYHAFGESSVVEEPTCAEAGYSIATCSCGATKKTMIPATGNHSYVEVDSDGDGNNDKSVCSECGLEAGSNYYINLVNTWKSSDGFSLKIKDISVEIKDKDRTLLDTLNAKKSIKQVDVTELSIYFKDGELSGAAIGSLELYDLALANANAAYEFKAIISDGYLYMKVEHGKDVPNQSINYKIKLDAMLDSIFKNMGMGDAEGCGSEILKFIDATVLPSVDALMSFDAQKTEDFLNKLFNIMFTFEQQTDGSYIATLDYEKLDELNENLATLSVADVVDIYLGADTFDDIVAWFEEIFALEISEIPEYVDDHGLVFDDLAEDINALALKIGMEDFDLHEVINDEEYEGKTFGMILFGCDDDSYLEDFRDNMDYLRENSLYQMINEDSVDEIKDTVSNIIDALADSGVISFTTDAMGTLKDIKVDIDNFTYSDDYYEITANFELEVKVNGTVDVTWNDIIDEIEGGIVLPDFDNYNPMDPPNDNNGNNFGDESFPEMPDDNLEDVEPLPENPIKPVKPKDEPTNDSANESFDGGDKSENEVEMPLRNAAANDIYLENRSGKVEYKGEYYLYTGAYFRGNLIDYDNMSGIIYETNCNGWKRYAAYYSGRSYAYSVATITVDGEEIPLLIDEYGGRAVELQKTETGFKAIYEDGEVKDVISDSETVDANVYFAIFKHSVNPFETCFNYYYNASLGQYAYDGQHKYKYEYEFEGETCDDGYIVHITCENCGYYSSYRSSSCDTEYVEIDISDKNTCQNSISVRRCKACGKIHDIDIYGLNCHLENNAYENIFDNDGNVIGKQQTRVCTACGLTVVSKQWNEYHTSCEYTYNISVEIFVGDTCVVEKKDSHERREHDLKYEYEFENNDCTKEYKVIVTCERCDFEDVYYTVGHQEKYVEIDLSEHGICGGYVSGYVCEICGNMVDSYYEPGCGDEWNEEDILDDDGNKIGTRTISSCSICEMVYIEEFWREYYDDCKCIEYNNFYIKNKDGISIVKSEDSHYKTTHEYEYTYELLGENCDDGYKATQHCKICGVTNEWVDSGHSKNNRLIWLSEKGMCEGAIEEIYCAVCNTVIDSRIQTECYFQHVEKNEDGYDVYECVRCHAQRLEKTVYGEKDENCDCRVSEYTIYVKDGVEIYSGDSYWYESMHEYEYENILNGESCLDGYTRITTCKDCDYYESRTGASHDTMVVFRLENIECSENHHVFVHVCACGSNFYYNCNGLNMWDSETGEWYCDTCDLRVKNYISNEEGTDCTEVRTETITVRCGEEIIYDKTISTEHPNHYFKIEVSDTDEKMTVTSSCEKCEYVKNGEVFDGEKLGVELTEDNRYYEYTFTPDQTARYIISACFADETHISAILYEYVNGSLKYVDAEYSNYSDSTALEAKLYEESTYVWRVELRDAKNIDAKDLIVGISKLGEVNCEHNASWSRYTLIDGSQSCEDGVLCVGVCADCGYVCRVSVEHEKYHNTYCVKEYDLTDYGACRGEIYYNSCACGEREIFGERSYICYDNWSSSQSYDDQNRLVNIEVHTCSKCGLRYEESYYTELDIANCRRIYYRTVSIYVGTTFVDKIEYQTYQTEHDCDVTYNFKGDSCEDGVEIVKDCKYCDYTYSETVYSHGMHEVERIWASETGCVCGGYITISKCPCEQRTSVSIDHVLCEFNSYSCKPWVEDVLTDGQEQDTDYWFYPDNYAYTYTCAVTDPACAYKIRYAHYWKKAENECYAYQYNIWQLGYDEKTGTCEREIVINTGERRIYHDYVQMTGVENVSGYECSDCGSYYYDKYQYDEYGNWVIKEYEYKNTLPTGTYSLKQIVEERTRDDEGDYYTSRYYTNYKYVNGTESEYERLRSRERYEGSFGNPGYKETDTISETGSEAYTAERAYVYYKGYKYNIYLKNTYEESGEWEKWEYSYSFDGICTKTIRYTNRKGEVTETQEQYCRNHSGTIKAPTCTQDGMGGYTCYVCAGHSNEYIISPEDHTWIQLAEGWYYCARCGLENANGVSGSIIMEDLTEKYGNGTNYVVGYSIETGVDFLQNVILVLPDGTEVTVENIEFGLIDGLRAVAFSKADVEAFAAANGYTDYEVKFAFIPVGSDGSLDYAITFTDTIDVTDTIVGKTSFAEFVDAEEIKIYTIAPTEDATWVFTSASYGNTYAYLCDSEGNTLTQNDIGQDGNNFQITYDLKAGETYTLKVKWYYVHDAGYMNLLFAPIN